MPTLTEYRRRMLHLDPSLGQTETITGLATTSVTAASLAIGTVGARKFSEKYLLRAEAALAGGVAVDRLRFSSDYTSSSGAIAHAGTNYADMTITGESVEIHEHEPRLLEQSTQDALQQTLRIDHSHLQPRTDGRYFLDKFSWVNAAQGVKVGRSGSRVLTGNRHFDQWGTVSFAGVLQPDRFALVGSGATFARSTTSRSRYSLSVTRSGTDATWGQTVQAVTGSANDDTLRGDVVTGVAVAQTTVASQVLCRVTSEKVDGTVLSTTDSSYHTASGSWEELTAEHTVHASADIVRVRGMNVVDGVCIADETYLVHGTLNDSERRDNFPVSWLEVAWTQNPLMFITPTGITGQVVIQSRRPYPTFDATRLRSGLADADSQDAPLDLIAYRALARFYQRQADGPDGNASLARRAEKYAGQADVMGAAHLAEPQGNERGAVMLTGKARGYAAGVV